MYSYQILYLTGHLGGKGEIVGVKKSVREKRRGVREGRVREGGGREEWMKGGGK
jgi:hypothetical protein